MDGNFFPDSPRRALARKNYKMTNILLGVNRDEGNYFNIYYLSDILKREVKRLSRKIIDKISKTIKMIFPLNVIAIVCLLISRYVYLIRIPLQSTELSMNIQ